jgi:hypothetical protein
MKENALYFQEHKHRENKIIHLQGSKAHTVSTQGKKNLLLPHV